MITIKKIIFRRKVAKDLTINLSKRISLVEFRAKEIRVFGKILCWKIFYRGGEF